MTQIAMEGMTVRLCRYKVEDAYFVDEKSAQAIADFTGGEVEPVEIPSEHEWIDGIILPQTTTPCDDAQAILDAGENVYLQSKYIPSATDSLTALGKELLKTVELQTADQRIAVAGLWPEWIEGRHEVDDIYTAMGQVWECFAAYDTAVYPDIYPGSPAWRTFNRPLHGTTPETAMPWAAPTNATDIYKSGEYMIWKEDKVYKCIMNTNFSPDVYALAWELVE